MASLISLLEKRDAAQHEQIADLEQWKRSATQVLDDLNLQEIGKELGCVLGTNIAKQILPWIKQQKLYNWLDDLPEITRKDKVACLLDDDYAIIYDRHGKAWSTETIDGRKVKRRHFMKHYFDS